MPVRTELLSDEVQEIINYKPHWIIRKGGIVFLIVALTLLALCWVIKYPDTVQGSVRIISTISPKLVVSRVDGKIEKLFAENNQLVTQGEKLAFMQSTADHLQILQLQEWIEEVERSETIHPIPLLNELGDIQLYYDQVRAAVVEIKAATGAGYYKQKRSSIVADLENIHQSETHLINQKRLAEQDYELQKTEFNAKEKLLKEKVIAPLEFNQDKSKLMSKKQVIEQMDAQLISNRTNELNKKKELLELEKTIADQKLLFSRELLNLKSKITEWIQRYIIVAPETGRLMFVSYLQPNQFINQGEELFNVQAPAAGYTAEMLVGQKNLGKIKLDQKVVIDTDGYPGSEFGFLEGKISEIANRPSNNDSFLLRVTLPKGLTTNFGKSIYFRNNLSAKGSIVTQNRRLISKFLGQLRNIFSR